MSEYERLMLLAFAEMVELLEGIAQATPSAVYRGGRAIEIANTMRLAAYSEGSDAIDDIRSMARERG